MGRSAQPHCKGTTRRNGKLLQCSRAGNHKGSHHKGTYEWYDPKPTPPVEVVEQQKEEAK